MSIETKIRSNRLRTILTVICVVLSLHVLTGCMAQPVDEPVADDKAVQAIPGIGIAAVAALFLATGVMVWSAQNNQFEASEGWAELDWFADMLTYLARQWRGDGDSRTPEQVLLDADASDWPDADDYRPVMNGRVDAQDEAAILRNSKDGARDAFGRDWVEAGDGCYWAQSMGTIANSIAIHYTAQSTSRERARSVAYTMCRRSSGFVTPFMECNNSGGARDIDPCPDAAWVMLDFGNNNHVFP